MSDDSDDGGGEGVSGMHEEEGRDREGPDRNEPEREPARGEDARGGGARSDDEVFAELVAAFDAPVDRDRRVWPEAEELTASSPPPSSAPLSSASPPSEPSGSSGSGSSGSGAADPVLGAGPGPRNWVLPSDDGSGEDSHFTPPEPPPLPRPESATRIAWGVMAAGPVLLLILWITGQDVGGWWGMLAGVLFVGGFVALVSRLKEDRDEDDDDPQSGAVV